MKRETAQQVRNKNNNRRPKKKSRIGKVLFSILLTLLIIGLIGLAVVYKLVMDIIDETEPIQVYDIEKLYENSVIYDSAGKEMAKVADASGLRTIVPYNKIDKDMINAIVAVEDKTFWEHSGFNYVRLVGSVVEALKTGKSPSGTSTITQQYARNRYLKGTRFAKGKSGYVRKVKEAYYSIDIEKNLSKEEIMRAYLNTIEFGANANGIQAATMRYFSKNCDDIDYIEAAILAGIPKANARYCPIKILPDEKVTSDDYVYGKDSEKHTIVFNKSCLDRYKVVIKVMHENGVIDDDEYKRAKNFDIRKKIKPMPLSLGKIESYPIDMVKKEVVQKLMEQKNLSKEEAEDKLYHGGLRIYSTIDPVMQNKLARSFNGESIRTLYDLSLKTAVKEFQRKNKLGADGIAGPNTMKKLAELGLLNPADLKHQKLRPGMNNEDVELLRNAMEGQGLIFHKNENIPSLSGRRNAKKDIVKESNRSEVMLNYYDNIIDDDYNLLITKDNYYKDEVGNIIFKKNKMFAFIKSKNSENKRILSLKVIDAYKCDESTVRGAGGGKVSIPEIHQFSGGLVKIPDKYAAIDKKGDYKLSKQFLIDNPDFFKETTDGTLVVKRENYNMATQGTIQPQAAMSIVDYRTGQLKAVMGGRNVSGKMIYNRAMQPRQPGSSIKPIGVYVPALDNGYSPSSVFFDTAYFKHSRGSNKPWPNNWYTKTKYKGAQTMRQAVEYSGNIIAVKVADMVGINKCIGYLKKFGVDTLVEDGAHSDKNPSSVALGGMTRGIKPFVMSGAYGAIANGGIRKETITFTKIVDSQGNLVLNNVPKETYIVDEKTAWLMQSMLLTAVEHGFSKNQSAIRPNNRGIPVAGKTGTTSSKYDIWFCGYTPYYSAAIWIGSDQNLTVGASSSQAAKYWKLIMQDIHAGYKDKPFKKPSEVGVISMSVDKTSGLLPSSLSRRDPAGNVIITDYFKPGNQPTKVDDLHVEVRHCTLGGGPASPLCPPEVVESKVYRVRPRDRVSEKSLKWGAVDSPYLIPGGYKPEVTEQPTCIAHDGETKTADTTSSLLAGVPTRLNADGSRTILRSILIKVKDGSIKNVDAGSVISPAGNVITTLGEFIYPWQMDSYSINPAGPSYNPSGRNNSTGNNNSSTNENNNTDSNEDTPARPDDEGRKPSEND